MDGLHQDEAKSCAEKELMAIFMPRFHRHVLRRSRVRSAYSIVQVQEGQHGRRDGL